MSHVHDLQVQTALRVSDLWKSYGSVAAIRGVGFEVRSAEVHALVGANGAGKSTVIRCLAGLTQPDSGTIEIFGEAVEIRNPQASTGLGLAFIHQELSLVPQFTAYDNIVLGLKPAKTVGLSSWSRYRPRVENLIAELEIDIDLDRPADTLSTSSQWLIAMMRALVRDARILVMDEPTASLSGKEVESLLAVCRTLSRRGVAILYVSHRLDEITQLCQSATVFRDGMVVDRIEHQDVTRERLIRGIAGETVAAISIPASRSTIVREMAVLEVRDLYRPPFVNGVSFTLFPGEVLGIAGLVGSGRTEAARIVVGADTARAGEVLLDGKKMRFRSPADARRSGIGLVPEERRSQGLIMSESITFNMALGWPLKGLRVFKTPIFSRTKLKRAVREIAGKVTLKAGDVGNPVSSLSGGNQQKVVLGRWLGHHGRVLVFDEPTRGVDVAARAQIHSLIRQASGTGVSSIVISSDLEELVGCDRVLVMVQGRISAELLGDQITEQRMLAESYGSVATNVSGMETHA